MTMALRLLLLEDNPYDAELAGAMLEAAGYTCHWERVETREDFLARLDTPQYDIILADYRLPSFDGLSALRLFRERCLDIPFVILSGTMGEEIAIESLKAGATDYVLKNRLTRLAPVVQRALREQEEQRQRQRAEAEQQHLEAQLVQAQKMESIGTLAGGIAHDFNNLLTVIFVNLHLLRTHLRPEDALQTYVTNIEGAADRATALTQQLLIFGRRKALERKIINLNETIESFATMLRRIIGEDVQVRLHLSPDIAPVLADPVQIDQVVMNLAVNARDAMPDGGQLLVETHATTLDTAYCQAHPWVQPGHYVQLIVSDTGCGMGEEVLQHIFEPFFTTKEVGKGTGLGLAVVYGIVKQHDGFIHVYSEVQHGTSVKIYFPAVEHPAATASHANQPVLYGGTETILVAEDDALLSELARMALTELGYKILLARDGREAVALFAAHRAQIDLVMLDVVMPHMSGVQVYKHLRNLGSTVPVLFMTGYSAKMTQATLAAETGALLLQKPYGVHELAHTLRQALEQARR
jgi:two-component system, cell cycle sensor histidine kinase and response regulator CckA